MMTGRDSRPAVDGGLARHIPVLGARIAEFLNVRAGGVYVDATFGAGGYTRAILAAANSKVIGIDRDPNVIAQGRALIESFPDKLVLVEGRFSNLDSIVARTGHAAIDGVVHTLSDVVTAEHLPPKILIIHRFTDNMITNAWEIAPNKNVQVVVTMDGFGTPGTMRRSPPA